MKKNDIGEEKIFYLISIMAAVSFVIGSLAIGISYYVSFEQQRARLTENVKSQARLIEAMAAFDNQFSTQDHPEGAYGATLSQVIMAHDMDKGFGETGEFTLARLEGDQIVFLFSHRFLDMDTPKPVPFDSDIAEPMRRALKGESGSIEGLDYRGKRVLAAFEPINWSDHTIGIVAKIDISEIRQPFAIAGLITGLLAFIILGFGIFVFDRLTKSHATTVSQIHSESKTDNYWFLAAPVLLAVVILYADITIPLGVAVGVPYVALFLFSILSPARFFIISIGILGTIMTVAGFFLSPEGGLLWMALINRYLAIFAIWITAILTLYHKETEIKAIDIARKLEKSQEIAHIGSCDWNIKTDKVSWSDETYKIFGQKPQEFKPSLEAFFDAIHPDDRENVKQAVDESIENDTAYNIEYRIVRPDNEERVVHDRAIVYRDDSGKPLHLIGTVHDITKRKEAEQELTESEQRFRKLSETAFEGIAITEKGKIVESNETFADMFGYTKNELIGMPVTSLPAPEYIETVSEKIAKGYEYVFEVSGLKKDGSTFPIEVHGISAPYQGRVARITAIRDITERKKAEEAFKASERKFRALAQSASDAIITANSRGEIVTWNNAAETIFGYSEGEALSQNITILVHERYQERHRRAFELAGLTGDLQNAGRTIEVEGVKKDGSEFPIELSLSSWRMDENLFFTSIIRDITERKRAEEALLESEERYRLIVEGVKIIAWEFNPNENIFTFVSGQAEEILGYQAERWYEKDFMESHIYHEDRKSTVDFCTKAFEKGKDHDFEYRMVSAKGRIVWLRDIVQIVKKDGQPIGTRGVMIDITDRKKAEQELLKYRDHLEELVNDRTEEIKLIQKIAVSANEAVTVDEAMLTCLKEVCAYTGWEIGHVYIPDDEGVCIPTDLWRVKNPERFDAFLKATMNTTFSPGVGLPGRVCDSGESVWVKDVGKDTNFPRAKIAEDIGMKAGFAFPVMEGGNVAAVLEFFTTIAVEPDQLLLDTVKHLAAQLGRLAERKRLEKELLLKNYAIDSSMNAMMMTNADFEITYVNQKMCELWGYAEKEMLGRDTSILRAEERLKGTIQKILSEKGEHEGEFLAIRKDGATFITHVSTSMVQDENGKIVSNVTSFVDLTERIRNEEALRESSRQLEESQRVANLGTYTLDISSGICSTSVIHDRIYGINNPKYIVNIEGWLNIIHPDQREEIKSYFTNHVLAKGAKFDKEYRIIRLNDRQERWVHGIGELILDQAERPVKMIGTIQDITERKRAEKALIAAKEAAEAATKLKDKFVSLASHDLRSPISSITGFLNFLKSDTKNTLCPEHEDIVDRMILTTDHQLNMIDGLLDLTRMQTGSILLEPRFANANLIGEDVVQNMLFMAQAKEIKLINDIPANARLYADITYFSEVIGNLVSNAIKFCSKGDQVRLFAPDNKKSIIAVSDTGIGIDSKTLCRLFAQEDKTSTIGTAGEKGSGLGLPYSYEIMQAHGGKLYAESTIGEGTVLFAKLPYIKPQILLVDDDERVRGMIKAYIDPLDVYIKQAVNGSEAIEILKLFVPHLIITDISMPVIDGLQLLEHVRGNPAIKSVPVIIMTGTDIHLRDRAFQMQASDFITKPLMEDEFLPRIRRFIG